MLSTTTTGSPPPKHRAREPQSPRQVIRQEAFRQPQKSPAVNERGASKARGGDRAAPNPSSSTTRTPLRGAAGKGNMLGHDDSEDPHDLALPTKHVARASMVDSLVMSLDQFSPTPQVLDRPITSSVRNHTSSQPVVPENEGRNGSRPTTSVRVGKADVTKVQSKEEQLTSLLGDDEDSHRSRAYAAQRAVQPSTIKSKQQQYRPSARSRSSSNSSSVDLGHLAAYTGRLGPPGTRRSQSFDFGSTQRVKSKDTTNLKTSTVPAPYVIQGPEPQSSLNKNTQVLLRRNSGRSAKSVHGKKRRSGTIGAATLTPKPDSPHALPSMTTSAIESIGRRQMSESIIEPPITPRPGFFRRVFGSSRNAGNLNGTSSAFPPSSARPSHERSDSRAETPRTSSPAKMHQQTTKPMADHSSNKETQASVTKKTSTFFRRRKKSISANAYPPLRLTLDGSLQVDKVEKDQQSPVSSLRAFMDPYLAAHPDTTPAHQSHHRRGSSLHDVLSVHDSTAGSGLAKQEQSDKHEEDLQQKRTNHNRQNSANLSKLQIPPRLIATSDDRTEGSDKKGDVSPMSTGSPSVSMATRTISPVSLYEDGPLNARKTPTPNLETSRPTLSNNLSSPGGSNKPVIERRPTNQSTNSIGVPPSATESEFSNYQSAPTTPTVSETRLGTKSPYVHVSQPSVGQEQIDPDLEQAKKILECPEDLIGGRPASAWLGEGGHDRERVRKAYMGLFDWSNKNILAALRSLCSKLALKGETQQVDRILDAFAQRWCECNANHGFRSTDIVHTVCYSILLLNTDLHLADIGQKMTRAQFITNAMMPIKQVADDVSQLDPPSSYLTIKAGLYTASSPSVRPSGERELRSPSASSNRPTDKMSREDSSDVATLSGQSGPLVDAPYTGSRSGWEVEVESVLRTFYTSISREPLPLFGQLSRAVPQPGSNNLLGLSGLRRTPSTLSKARSESRGREAFSSKSLGARFASKQGSRSRLGSTQGFGSSRTSFDDGSSAWSPMSSTWSKTSIGKTLTSMSVDSFAIDKMQGGYQSSIGFANALSQAIIRDEQMDAQPEEGIKAAPLLEDESLELHGAPWAKEGILKHKCHLEGTDKRSRDRNWNDCFAVIEKGWMRLFSFSVTAKTLRNKAKNQKPGAGAIVGGGNWQDSAEEVWKFMLRHTIASSLPPPGYSKQRPYVWALSLPNGAVHLFSVGTPDIVKEFVSTANFWSARLSKEPMTGGVTSMEYGWSDMVVNRQLITSESYPALSAGSPRPSTQMSMRSSIDHGVGGFRPRLPGDKVYISEWNPPTQSLLPSQLMEVDQLKALQSYVRTVESELSLHNELRQVMLLAFTSRHPNANGGKAMANWEKKSSYLLREIVKFTTYIDALTEAQKTKKRIYRMRQEDEEQRKDEKAEKAFRLVNEDRD